MADGGGEIYELSAGSYTNGELKVISFVGAEGLSRLFVFDVQAMSEIAPSDAQALVEQPATLTLESPSGSPRAIQGIVEAVEAESRSGVDARRAYRIRIAPKLAVLRRRRNSRIFQAKTVQEIATTILGESDVAARWAVVGPLSANPYCVQYDETDYAFLRRILAERGLVFWFEAGDDGSSGTVVLSDTASSYASLGDGDAASLSFRSGEGQKTGDEHVTVFGLEKNVRTKATLVRDYDFRRPLVDLAATARVGDDGAITSATAVSTSGGAIPTSSDDAPDSDDASSSSSSGDAGSQPATDAPKPFEVYSHRGEYGDGDVNADEPRQQLEQLRRRVVLGRGVSTCRRLGPGATFSLEGHPIDEVNGSYVVVKMTHDGIVPERAKDGQRATYTNTFECVPATTLYRPKRPKRKVRQVVESARVVGPPGEELYVDELGRIKVQFHWDREGSYDHESTCWMRVAQPWSGASWGHQYIPRVGMEVLVAFIGGDVDRPVVVGSVPNAELPSPFALPGATTKSGIRTRSVPGGSGHNELSFDDRAGGEVVHLRAERDLTERVGRDHASVVEGGRSALVRGGDSLQVNGPRMVRVGENLDVEITGNEDDRVLGDAAHFVGGDRADVVEGELTLRVDKSQTVMIGADPKQDRSNTFVVGDWGLGTDGVVRIKAAGGLSLECGDNKITISKDSVKIETATLEMKASKSVSVSGPGPSMKLDDAAEITAKKLTLITEKATMQLDHVVDVRAPTVKLNCTPTPPESADPNATPPATAKLSVRLTDPWLNPYAKKKYHLFAGVDRYDGETDDDGLVSHDLPDGTVRADITLWIEEFPTGARRYFVIHIVDDVPDASDLKGVQIRLRNLGYFEGECDGQAGEDLEHALRWLQQDQGIEPTGQPDDATKAKLTDLHGF